MARGTAQPGNLCQNVKALFSAHVVHTIELIQRCSAQASNQLSFLGAGRDGQGDLSFWRQLAEDLRFSSAQQKRCDQLPQHGFCRAARVTFNRPAETALKFFLTAQQSRIEKAHQAPKLSQVVFQWRSAGGDTKIALQCACGLGSLGCGILDRLRFVQNNAVKVLLSQRFAMRAQ